MEEEEDNDDDPFRFEEISNSAATTSSLNNNNKIVKSEEDLSSAACSHNPATGTNRVPQTATSTSFANQFIFDSVGFCVLHADYIVTKSSSKAYSTATANHTITKGMGVGATQVNYTTPSNPTDIQLTFSI